MEATYLTYLLIPVPTDLQLVSTLPTTYLRETGVSSRTSHVYRSDTQFLAYSGAHLKTGIFFLLNV